MQRDMEMKSTRGYNHATLVVLGVIVVAVAMGGVLLNGQGPARTSWTTMPPPGWVPRDQTTQLALKITEPFTLAGVGDIIERMPISKFDDPAFQGLVKIMQDADVTVANMESQIIDVRSAPHPIGGQYGSKEIAADLKAMGIDMVNRANNVTMNTGEAGMLETARYLEEAGIVHAGAGVNLEDARAARYLDTSKGRVALVGMFAMDQPSAFSRTAATYQVSSLYGALRGRAGLNALGLTPHYVVTREQLDALKNIRSALLARRGEVAHPIGPVMPNEPVDRLQLFETWYKVGSQTGAKSYTMNPDDLRDNLRSIRNAKYYADFVVAMTNVHQNSFAFQAYSQDNSVPDFMIELAHKAIDNGADVFLASGVHTLRGVEIYKGKPIFYGLSNYIYHLSYMDPDAGDIEEARSSHPELTDAEVQEKKDAWVYVEDNTEVLLATSRYEKGQLVEVRLYPADVASGRSRPISRIGIPMTPSPEVAQKILSKMQTISKPFGTVIAIENNIGVIRVSPSAPKVPSPE